MINSVSPSMVQSLAAVRFAVGAALSAAAQALASGGDAATGNAQREWRLAHAAMQIVNHRALLQFSTELGALIAATGIDAPAQAAAFSAGAAALTVFVETLSTSGRAHVMRLWPAYAELQRVRGIAEPHQGELFFPAVNLHPGERAEATVLSANALRSVRRELEAGLLQWLRNDDMAGIHQIAGAVRRVEEAQRSGSARRLWWIASGVLEAVQQGGLSADLQLRHWLTQLDLQLGRLVQGAPDVPDAPEALLRESLYLAARAQPQVEMQMLHAVRRLYRLDGALDVAAEDAAAAATSCAETVAAARRDAVSLQALWSACAQGSGVLAEFEQRVRALADTCVALAQPALTALIAQLAEHAHALAQPGPEVCALSEAAALEGACALLMIESALADHTPAAQESAGNFTLSAGFAEKFTLSAGFAARAHHMAARLKLSVLAPQALGEVPPAQLLDEAAQPVQAAALRGLAHAEITRNFAAIERTLNRGLREPADLQQIAVIDQSLRQAGGVLSLLGHTAAAALTAQCRADVARYAHGARADETQQRALTARLAALSAFVVVAQHGPAQLAEPLTGVTPVLVPATAPAALPLEVVVDTTSATLAESPLADAAGAAGGVGAAGAAETARPLLRVRTDLIERIAKQAGEMRIAGARASAELRSARATLHDFSDTIGRQRAQWCALEMQAETQMPSRLTRQMVESVNDLATVQHSLARALDEGEKALASQAQMARDVQRDLMAIRMAPFASISGRLLRVVRLSAQENSKRVELDISGGSVEVEHSVLERIVAPIEHLLRNAVVHGIEALPERLAAGKPPVAVLRIAVRQEGNAVVLTLADDGAGLNLARIRELAIALGWMRENEQLSDQQIGHFIFRSGLSTAHAVTADGERGIGMAEVMSEISALGGRVGTTTLPGKGTTFSVHLPLTWSLLQAVVMRVGGNAFAVPTMMVEQVQRLKAEVLGAAHAAGVIEWQNARYAFHHLSVLLDRDESTAAQAAPDGWVLLLRSGAERAAIQVDALAGRQALVIQNLGPQLARVPGVSGAALLDGGETVLVLNPLLLSQRHSAQLVRRKVVV